MTKKLVIGILFISFLLFINLVFAAERSFKAPAIANLGEVPSNCDCWDENSAPLTPEQPLNMIMKPEKGECWRKYATVCLLYDPWRGCLCWGTECWWECDFTWDYYPPVR